LKIKSIAFPALGCGVGNFPLVAAAKIMAQEVLKHLRENKSGLQEIIFCLYSDEALKVFQKNVTGYLEYIQHKLSLGPFTTVDAIIELPEGIILIERSNPPFGWALPGGFVDYGESLEDAVKREAKEETNLDLTELRQFHAYSEPDRDPRFHTIGTVFVAKAKGSPKAGDDAQGLKIVKYEDLLRIDYAFDHKKIIQDYLQSRKKI
jgi:ADP-ribose pyrophosphatase YjhB (NUDIX family)